MFVGSDTGMLMPMMYDDGHFRVDEERGSCKMSPCAMSASRLCCISLQAGSRSSGALGTIPQLHRLWLHGLTACLRARDSIVSIRAESIDTFSHIPSCID